MELSRLDYAILKILHSKNCKDFFHGMTIREIIEQTGTAKTSTARVMYRLAEYGYVERGYKSINAKTYYLTDKAVMLLDGGKTHDKE